MGILTTEELFGSQERNVISTEELFGASQAEEKPKGIWQSAIDSFMAGRNTAVEEPKPAIDSTDYLGLETPVSPEQPAVKDRTQRLWQGKPQLTQGRLAQQMARSVGKGVASIGEMAVASEEQNKLDAVVPFPNGRGWEKPITNPMVIQSYDQRQFGEILRKIEKEEKARPSSQRINEEWEKYKTKKHQVVMDGAKKFVELFPEKLEGSSGRIEDAVSGVTEFLPAMAVTAANPYFGTAVTYAQIMGSSYSEYRKKGYPPDKSFATAAVNSVVQTGLEMAGNLLQINAIKNTAKAAGLSLGFGAKLQSFVGNLMMGTAGEGMEEFLQQYPDEIANIYLANPDLTTKELTNEVIKQKGKITERAIDASATGALGGLMLTGAGQIAVSPLHISEYISEKQRKINEKKAAKLEADDEIKPIIEKDYTLEPVEKTIITTPEEFIGRTAPSRQASTLAQKSSLETSPPVSSTGTLDASGRVSTEQINAESGELQDVLPEDAFVDVTRISNGKKFTMKVKPEEAMQDIKDNQITVKRLRDFMECLG